MPLRVAIIVEGHGEVEAIRKLLQRIWYELLQGDSIEVLRPWRCPQGTLLAKNGLIRNIEKASLELRRKSTDQKPACLMILVDSEKACPKELAPQLLEWAREACSDLDIVCVMPHPMFETWFVAAANSLVIELNLEEKDIPTDPEAQLFGKTWVKKRRRRKYSETTDQPRFVDMMDLVEARSKSPSFDKLCRELERRCPKPASDSTDSPR